GMFQNGFQRIPLTLANLCRRIELIETQLTCALQVRTSLPTSPGRADGQPNHRRQQIATIANHRRFATQEKLAAEEGNSKNCQSPLKEGLNSRRLRQCQATT